MNLIEFYISVNVSYFRENSFSKFGVKIPLPILSLISSSLQNLPSSISSGFITGVSPEVPLNEYTSSLSRDDSQIYFLIN